MTTLVALLAVGMYVGWNIGANDAGNCIGTAVGSGLLSFRKAALLVGAFALAGAALQGDHVMKTLGKGIVQSELPSLAIIVALLCAGLFVTLATLMRLPVSTSQVIVGAVGGIGVAVGAELNLSTLGSIALVWVVCPVLTAIISGLILMISRKLLGPLIEHDFWQRLPNGLLIASAAYLAFSLGANHVGTAMGPITNLGVTLSPAMIGTLGGAAMAVGALTFGKRVTKTVGGGIARLDPMSAFAAQLSAALAVHFFSLYGIPVSTSQAVVGAILGVGLLNGVRTVRCRTLVEIAIGWVATPLSAGLVAFVIYSLIQVANLSP